MRSTEYTVRL